MKITQKELKEMIKNKVVEDITRIDNINELIKKENGLETIALSFGIYGRNAGLAKGNKTGKLYGITARNSNLFVLN